MNTLLLEELLSIKRQRSNTSNITLISFETNGSEVERGIAPEEERKENMSNSLLTVKATDNPLHQLINGTYDVESELKQWHNEHILHETWQHNKFDNAYGDEDNSHV